MRGKVEWLQGERRERELSPENLEIGRVLRSGVRAGGKWPAGATAKSLVQAGHLSTAVVIADLR